MMCVCMMLNMGWVRDEGRRRFEDTRARWSNCGLICCVKEVIVC